MAFLTKTFTTTCPGDLIPAINTDPALNGVVCYQIIDTNDGNSTFEFDRVLTGPEESAFDSLLSGWVCPVYPPEGDGSETVNDSLPPSTETLWTSDKTNTEITNASDALDLAKADKVSPVVAGNIPGLDASGNLTDSGFKPADFATTVHTHVETDITDLDRVRWKRNYSSVSYDKNDMVLDGAWTMIANKTTEDRAAPTPNGDPKYTFTDTPAWTPLANTSVVISGNQFTFTKSGWVQRLRVWVPSLTSDTNYRFVVEDVTNPAVPIRRIINDPLLVENQWTDIAVGSTVVTNGTIWNIYADALNSGSETTFSGGWLNDGEERNNPDPPSGAWQRNKHEVLYFNKIDLDSTDRTTELMGVIPNSTILIVDTTTPSLSWEFLVLAEPIDEGDFVTYLVSRTVNNGNPTTGLPTTCTFTIPIPSPTQFVELPNYWTSNSPDFATVTGFLEFNGVEQSGKATNGYGVDIYFQEALVSPDWDLVSSSEISSTGTGGAGGGIGEAPQDGTPYSRQDALWVSSVTSLSGLSDVDNALAPSNGQILVYNNSNSTFEAQNQTGLVQSVFTRTGDVVAQSGDYSSTLIGNLSNITGTTVTDALNTTNSHLIDNSIHYTKASINLNDLGNVTAGSPNTSDLLSWNGSAWVNSPNTQGGDLATVTASRATDYVMPTAGSFNDIPFDKTDVENDTAVVEHDDTNVDNFLIKETGVYGISFSMTAQPQGSSVSNFTSRVRVNDTTVLPGSERSMSEDGEANDMSNYFTVELTAGDFITLQINGSVAGDGVNATSNISIARFKGTKGDQGATGATGTGSTILLKDEGTGLSGQYTTLNFVGSGVTVTNAGSQEATVDVSGGGGGAGISGYSFFADGFQTPFNSNWNVSNFAPITLDPSNQSFLVRAFDDSTAEGVGFPLNIPTGTVSINVTYRGRMSSSSGSSVQFRLSSRLIPNNASTPAWQDNAYTQTLTMKGNANYATWTGSFTLASASLTAGETYLFELYRNAGSDAAAGDFYLYEYAWSFA